MKRTILLVLFSSVLANAGILKVVTYPLRHPAKTIQKTVHVTKRILW